MRAKFYVQNLKCGGCANTIKKSLLGIEGVEVDEVNVLESIVVINYNTDKTVELVQQKLAKLGYPIMEEENTMLSQAKSFVSCAVGRLSRTS